MKSYYDENCETLEGVNGQWLTITKSEQAITGQRVRYSGTVTQFGYTEKEIIIVKEDGTVDVYQGDERVDSNLFSDFWKNIQVFCPLLPVERKKAKKVAKINIHNNVMKKYWFETRIGAVSCIHRNYYTSHKSAIRGAQRFCKTIGYEYEIAK